MARGLRHTPEGGALFDVTCRTVQSRFLLRPGPLLNEIILGALARAKRRYGVEISAFIFLSSHLHILAWALDSEQLARFMNYFLSKLAREVSRLTGWRDKVFARRYQAIPISEEEAAQVERLLYILSNGCKENLVARPQDWPGVHCVDALLTGQPMTGTWFDRTQEFAARNRGESFGSRKYATEEILALDPLPCWRHLSPAQYRAQMAGLVEKIIAETEARRKETGSQPLGPDKILAQHPFGQPAKTKRSFAPRAHAFSREIRKAMYEAYAAFVAAFRDAAEKLRGGDRMARFPEGSFPPGLPFVRGGLPAVGFRSLELVAPLFAHSQVSRIDLRISDSEGELTRGEVSLSGGRFRLFRIAPFGSPGLLIG